jgi:hypothetical protein
MGLMTSRIEWEIANVRWQNGDGPDVQKSSSDEWDYLGGRTIDVSSFQRHATSFKGAHEISQLGSRSEKSSGVLSHPSREIDQGLFRASGGCVVHGNANESPIGWKEPISSDILLIDKVKRSYPTCKSDATRQNQRAANGKP